MAHSQTVVPIRWLSIGVCTALLAFFCTSPLGTGPDGGKKGAAITLSLQAEKVTAADYTGAPILVNLDFADTVAFGDIEWHVGDAILAWSDDVSLTDRITRLQVQVSWNRFPQTEARRGADTLAYDSLYVTVAGTVLKSNIVRVYVINIPPVIYAVTINSRHAAIDREYSLFVADTSSKFTMAVTALDANDQDVWIIWKPENLVLPDNPGSPSVATYRPLALNFRDTIHIYAYDGNGGSAHRAIIMFRRFTNHRPVIDSIRAGDTLFTGSNPFFRFATAVFDSVPLQVYVHDVDTGEELTYSWQAKKVDNMRLNVTVPARASYICPDKSCRDTVTDDIEILDTVRMIVRDACNDSAYRTVYLMHGPFALPPRFDSLRINGVRHAKPDTLRDTMNTRDSVLIRAYASPFFSGDPVTYGWTTGNRYKRKLVMYDDTAAMYRADTGLYSDTITLRAASSGLSDTVRIILVVNNHWPVIDSIVVRGSLDTAYTRTDTLVRHVAAWHDTMRFRVKARDADRLDSLKYCWLFQGDTISHADTLFRICNNLTWVDTVRVVVQDQKKAWAIRRILIYGNYAGP